MSSKPASFLVDSEGPPAYARFGTAAMLASAALALTACGGGDNGSASGTAAQGSPTESTTQQAPTTTSGGQQTPTAPKSATAPSTGAPDEGIQTRPGGPGQDSGY